MAWPLRGAGAGPRRPSIALSEVRVCHASTFGVLSLCCSVWPSCGLPGAPRRSWPLNRPRGRSSCPPRAWPMRLSRPGCAATIPRASCITNACSSATTWTRTRSSPPPAAWRSAPSTPGTTTRPWKACAGGVSWPRPGSCGPSGANTTWAPCSSCRTRTGCRPISRSSPPGLKPTPPWSPGPASAWPRCTGSWTATARPWKPCASSMDCSKAIRRGPSWRAGCATSSKRPGSSSLSASPSSSPRRTCCNSHTPWRPTSRRGAKPGPWTKRPWKRNGRNFGW